MSRTDPDKKKRRCANRTLLMFGEGLGEETFLKYLRQLYARDSGVAVTIRNGRGGSAPDIIRRAARELGDYERRVVILDNDKDRQEMSQARAVAKQSGIELVEITPCLEAMFLSILNNGKSFSDRETGWCKTQFERNYLDRRKRLDANEYGNTFPKDLLEGVRNKIEPLDKIISLMEKSVGDE